MIEILGGDLENAFFSLGINAKKTYEGNTYLDDKTQVWEISDEDFNKLYNIKDKDWNDDWGWWRYAKGSNMGLIWKRYNINKHYIKAWDGNYRENHKDKYQDRNYDNLLRYFCDEIGASTETNVTALAIDLARQNNMSLSELFQKFQSRG